MQMFTECTEENVGKIINFCFAVISNCHKNITILLRNLKQLCASSHEFYALHLELEEVITDQDSI